MFSLAFRLGGKSIDEIYILTDVHFKIDGFELTIPITHVETNEYSTDKNYDGILGQDVLMHFDEMIINYKDMYLTFMNKNE